MTDLLTGVRVLDLTNVLAGPFCCSQLAYFGAEVIKIEPPGRGDLARQLGADTDLNSKDMGASFLAQNAGKKSVSINLKDTRGKNLFFQLVATADVVVENFRPGVMNRLGLTWESLKTKNNKLIYCAISGFGQNSPWSNKPAYDQIVQGLSGLMSINGAAGQAPLRVGYPLADTISGLTAAFAICAALNKKEASYIDVSMLESLLVTMGWVISNWLIAGEKPTPQGNENPTSAPSGTFQAQDAKINIAANKEEQWRILANYIGRDDLLEDVKYLTREDRKKNRSALNIEIESAISMFRASDLAEALTLRGVPAGVVMEVPDILKHPVIADSGFLTEFENVPGIGRNLKTVSTGVKINNKAPFTKTPPPELGQDNFKVFGELGIDLSALNELKRSGVI